MSRILDLGKVRRGDNPQNVTVVNREGRPTIVFARPAEYLTLDPDTAIKLGQLLVQMAQEIKHPLVVVGPSQAN